MLARSSSRGFSWIPLSTIASSCWGVSPAPPPSSPRRSPNRAASSPSRLFKTPLAASCLLLAVFAIGCDQSDYRKAVRVNAGIAESLSTLHDGGRGKSEDGNLRGCLVGSPEGYLQLPPVAGQRRPRRPVGTWGGRWGLNPQRPEPQSGALPIELRPPLSE